MVQHASALHAGEGRVRNCCQAGFSSPPWIQEGQVPIPTQTQPLCSWELWRCGLSFTSFISNCTRLTFMVTVMVLLTFALCSQPCFITPPFWEHREEESWKTANNHEKRSGKLFPTGDSPWTKGFVHPGKQYHFNYSNRVTRRMYVQQVQLCIQCYHKKKK